MKILKIATGILLAVTMIMAEITLDESAGTLNGTGSTKSGKTFPVLAQTFQVTLSNPVNLVRTLTVTIPVKQITTDNWMRDAHMRMSVFKGKAEAVIFTAETTAELTPGQLTLNGNLEINGRTVPGTLDLIITPQGKDQEVTGKTTVLLSDYGIKPPGMGPMKVSDEIELQFDILVPGETELQTGKDLTRR